MLCCCLALFLTKLCAQVGTDSSRHVRFDPVKSGQGLKFENNSSIPERDSTNAATKLDSADIRGDSLSAAKGKRKKNDIETTINYSSEDSMVFDLKGRKLHLFGNSHIDYGDIALESDRINIDWNKRSIKSQYTVDTLGNKIGKPVFSDGKDQYETNDILYNFKTKRAVIKGVVTQQDGAVMHGEDVKKNEENEMFIRDAKYTTCTLADPHFFIKSEKIKLIPENKAVSGPFILKFREVPTPLAFPLGMFPQPREKASGIIFPNYTEERRRGFSLRDAGYYFGFSEYFDMRLTGSVYSKGSYEANALINYKVRYKFNGSLSLQYLKNVIPQEIGSSIAESTWIRWNLRPETKGNASFSANVNAGSSNFNNQSNLALTNPAQNINSNFQSSVSYSQRFRKLPFNMSSNFRMAQNISTGIYNVSFPDFSLNMNRMYPFKKIVKSSKSPLAKINLSHNFVARNNISNAPVSTSGLGFTPTNHTKPKDNEEPAKLNWNNLDELYDRAKIGGRHTVPISTSFNLLKYLTVNPSFNYQEVWYTRELAYTEEKDGVRVDTVEGFSRAGSWTSGASMNTRVYGMYYLKRIKGIEAVRHVMTPSISFSYNPDFSDEKYGVYRTIRLDSTGEKTRRVSKYQNFAYGSPSGRESKTLSLSLTNNIEMKVKSNKDTAEGFKKVKLFDNLSVRSGYNFAADSFKLGNISWNARTSLFNKKITVALTGTYDPYVYVENGTERGRRIDRYAWNNGGGPGTLSRLNTSVNLNLKPKKKKKNKKDRAIDPGRSAFANDGTPIEQSEFGTEDEKNHINQNPEEYVDFNMPWTLQARYNINRSQSGLADPQTTSHGLQINGTLGLTANTQITFNTGYDIKNKDFTQTSIGVVRDLHCWTLNFRWVPFGRFQSFSLVIRPKSSILQDLKIQRRRSFQDFFAD